MWKFAFEAMEKKAIGMVMPLIMGGLTASDIASRSKENIQKNTLRPQAQNNNYKLMSPQAYQFEGGKHTDLKPTRVPHLSTY